MKKTIQKALMDEYGFKPPLADINVLSYYHDYSYIMFEINGHEYEYDTDLEDSVIVKRC